MILMTLPLTFMFLGHNVPYYWEILNIAKMTIGAPGEVEIEECYFMNPR